MNNELGNKKIPLNGHIFLDFWRHPKWIDWIVFTICISLISPILNIFVYKLHGVPFTFHEFYSDLCIITMAFSIDAIKNFQSPNKIKNKNIKTLFIVIIIFLGAFNAMIYEMIIKTQLIDNTPIVKGCFAAKTSIAFVIVGLIIDFISVFKRR